MPKTRAIFDYPSAKLISNSADQDKLGEKIATYIEATGLKSAGGFEFKPTGAPTKSVDWTAEAQEGVKDVFTVHINRYG
jgi:hypothetical protein